MERFVERLLQAVAIAVVVLAAMQIHDARTEETLPTDGILDCIVKGRIGMVLAIGVGEGLSLDQINVIHNGLSEDSLDEWESTVATAKDYFRKAVAESPNETPEKFGQRVAAICAYFYGKERT